jgi:hypothetical protein
MRVIISPDTNFFIHFRDPRELDRYDIVQAQKIKLVVGRAVQKELQKKRFELRGWAQERARHYAKLLGDMTSFQKRPAALARRVCMSNWRSWGGRPVGPRPKAGATIN